VAQPQHDGVPGHDEPGVRDEPGAYREPGDSSEPGTAVVAHLQRAALEVIAAARAMLDVAERVVVEPTVMGRGMGQGMEQMASLAKLLLSATEAARTVGERVVRAQSAEHDPATPPAPAPERIEIR